MRYPLGCAAYMSGLIGIVGALAGLGAAWFAGWMIGAAMLGCVWGLLRTDDVERYRAEREAVWARRDGACPTCDHPLGDIAHACIGGDLADIERRWWLDEPELPYQPAEHRPIWDTPTWGAPE